MHVRMHMCMCIWFPVPVLAHRRDSASQARDRQETRRKPLTYLCPEKRACTVSLRGLGDLNAFHRRSLCVFGDHKHVLHYLFELKFTILTCFHTISTYFAGGEGVALDR
jgi:hypothetical protein